MTITENAPFSFRDTGSTKLMTIIYTNYSALYSAAFQGEEQCENKDVHNLASLIN